MKKKKFFKFLLVVCAFLFAYNFSFLNVRGHSMLPSYSDGELLLALRVRNEKDLPDNYPACWIVDENGSDCIKRLVGYPGDVVELIKGDTYVNDTKIMSRHEKYNNDCFYKFVLDEGEYLFLGDNRSNSLDARYWKKPSVSINKIRGVVLGGGLS